MKYVMFAKDMEQDMTHYVPIMFPDMLVHAMVASEMSRLLPGYEVVSAGHFNPAAISIGTIFCYGESETLGIPSDPMRDSRIIYYNNYGGSFQ